MGCSNSKSTNVVDKKPEKALPEAVKETCAGKPILYWFRGSPPSSATHEIALMCLGLENFETKEIDLSQGEHKSEAYLKINAAGQVPALTHGDQKFAESRAIQQLIVRHSEKCQLLGGDDIKCQAKVQAAMYHEASSINPKIVKIVVPVIFGGELDKEEMKATLMPVFESVDKKLSESKFFAGESLTLVDINMIHNIALFSLLGDELFKHVMEQHKPIVEWFKNCMMCEEYKNCVASIAENYPGGQSAKVLAIAKMFMEM